MQARMSVDEPVPEIAQPREVRTRVLGTLRHRRKGHQACELEARELLHLVGERGDLLRRGAVPRAGEVDLDQRRHALARPLRAPGEALGGSPGSERVYDVGLLRHEVRGVALERSDVVPRRAAELLALL